MLKNIKKILCTTLVIILLGCCGCIEKKSNMTIKDEIRDYVIYGINGIPDDLNMLNYRYDECSYDEILNGIFEGLVKKNSDGSIVPALAESWSVSDDKLEYKFKIRENALWSDGEKITTDDFICFFSKLLNKNTENVYDYQLFYIFGAENYRNGNTDFSSVAITETDDNTLKIKLNYPCDYFIDILAQPMYGLRVIDEKIFDWKSKYKNIKYSGPYCIDNFSMQEGIVLKKNNEYWNVNSVKSNKILIKSFSNRESLLAAFQSSKVDVFLNPPKNEVNRLKEINAELEFESNCSKGLIFNFRNNKLIDKNARKIIFDSIDVKTISESILNSAVVPITNYSPIKKISQSADKPKNYDNKSIKNINKIRLIYLNTAENKKICSQISKDIKDNLNISVELNSFSADKYKNMLKSSKYDLALVNYNMEYNNSMSYFDKLYRSNYFNFGRFNNNQFNSAVWKAKIEINKLEKDKLLKKAEGILNDEVPTIPLFYEKNILCKNEYIDNINVYDNGVIPLDKLTLTKK